MIRKIIFLLVTLLPVQNALATDATDVDRMQMKITINETEYNVALENNETVSALQSMLPLTLSMADLNNNEKYYYLEQPLPNSPEKVKSVSTGDIMLFGDDCLVVFYKDFETPYSYTRIGHIGNTDDDLEQSLGSGNVEITFDKIESFMRENMK